MYRKPQRGSRQNDSYGQFGSLTLTDGEESSFNRSGCTSELNRLLEGATDFNVEIVMNDKNDIDFLLIRDNLYYGLSRIVLIIYNSRNNNTILQFVLLELAEIIAILGY